MFAVMMANPLKWAVQEAGVTVGYSDAVVLLTLVILPTLALGLAAEWMSKRLTLKRAAIVGGTSLGMCVLVAVMAGKQLWMAGLIYYWDHYWFWGCFC